jgi:hypothetical protein
MLLGSRKDKYGVLRRLLKGLEEGVKGCCREHVNLIDYEYRVPTLLWYDTHLLDKVADVIYRVV